MDFAYQRRGPDEGGGSPALTGVKVVGAAKSLGRPRRTARWGKSGEFGRPVRSACGSSLPQPCFAVPNRSWAGVGLACTHGNGRRLWVSEAAGASVAQQVADACRGDEGVSRIDARPPSTGGRFASAAPAHGRGAAEVPDRYDPRTVEARWRQVWRERAEAARGVPEADGRGSGDRLPRPGRRKHYALTMFPYPSGDLHIGHWYAMVPADVHARYHRMRGADVIFPIGFDAFGLPAENAAIKRGIHPHRWTMANIERMRDQLRTMGAAFDWDREIVTCDPEYYRWNQWLFLRFFEKGLAYKKFAPVDFCPNCNTTVAREQVVGPDRLCERCDTPVVRRDLDQWFLRITAYADRLLDGLDSLDWPERAKRAQVLPAGLDDNALA